MQDGPLIDGSSIHYAGQTDLMPSQFVEKGMDDKYHEDYMFMDCIKFINSVSVNCCGEALQMGKPLENLGFLSHLYGQLIGWLEALEPGNPHLRVCIVVGMISCQLL